MQNSVLKFRKKLYYFRETRLFVRIIENFDQPQLPQRLILLAEILPTFPT